MRCRRSEADSSQVRTFAGDRHCDRRPARDRPCSWSSARPGSMAKARDPAHRRIQLLVGPPKRHIGEMHAPNCRYGSCICKYPLPIPIAAPARPTEFRRTSAKVIVYPGNVRSLAFLRAIAFLTSHHVEWGAAGTPGSNGNEHLPAPGRRVTRGRADRKQGRGLAHAVRVLDGMPKPEWRLR
jgi:hypothetical protein